MIDDLRATIEGHFPGRWRETEACLSTIATLLLSDSANPVGLNLVGVPSNVKTTILSFFYGLKDIVYKSDQFTPKSFVSHATNVKQSKLKDIDLLPRIRGRCLIVPELAPLFGKRKDDLLENLSVLTRVFDGEGLMTDSGTQGQRGYEGDYGFAWLGATTPLDNRVWKVMGKLGSRLLFLNVPEEGDTARRLDRLTNNVRSSVSYQTHREQCQQAVHDFLSALWVDSGGFRSLTWDSTQENETAIDWLARLADLLAHLRGILSVYRERSSWDGEEYNHTIPIREQPDRAMSLLYNLVRGRALLHGRRKISMDDLPMAAAIALSSMPDDRRQAFESIRKGGGVTTTSQIESKLGCSAPTARQALKTLSVLGVVSLGTTGHEMEAVINPDFAWSVDEPWLKEV